MREWLAKLFELFSRPKVMGSKTVNERLIALSFSLFLAIFWESFEVVAEITSIHSLGYLKDSLGDIVFTVLGGVTAFYVFRNSEKSI